MASPVCPAHGGDRLDFIEAYELNGMRDPPMLVCGACMDAGATPGGCWNWVLEDLPVLPFLPEFHPKVQDGRKTATARSKAYGAAGDFLQGPGCVLRLDSVQLVQLNEVAYDWFRQEGLESPDEFIAVWKRIHPRAGYVPTKPVHFHRFHRMTEVQRDG